MAHDNSFLIENARNRLTAQLNETERKRREIDARVRNGNANKPDVIPAVKKPSAMESDAPLRVAAYCRVSTDALEQETSYELQKDHFEKFIRMHPNWKLVGIYADKGKSGTNTKHRHSFLKLIDDCNAGKIDLIVTRAVSRFARNLLDCLDNVRKLKEIGVEVYFEQENLRTLDGTSEMILTVLSMVAQEESHIKSEAMNSSIEIRFGLGMFLTPGLIGYDHIGPGQLQLNYSESLTVKKMYYMLLSGSSPSEIAKELMRLGRPTKPGNYKWTSKRVIDVLRNERYCGDVLARKTFTCDYIKHKSVKNRGERNQYYKKDHHEAIVTREQWETAQKILSSYRYQHDGAFIPLTVIDNGLLRGFISINRAWAGYSLAEYIEASRSAMGDDLPAPASDPDENDPDESGEETVRNAFQVASSGLFSRKYEPAMRIKRGKILFSKTCTQLFDEGNYIPTRVEMLLNPVLHSLAVRKCPFDSPNAIRWVDDGGSSRELGCSRFSAMLFELLGLGPSYSYSFTPQLRKNGEERILFFDLDNYRACLPSRSRNDSASDHTPETEGLSEEDKPIEIRSGPDLENGYCFGEYSDMHAQYGKNSPQGEWNIHEYGRDICTGSIITPRQMQQLDNEIEAVSIAEEQLRKENEGRPRPAKSMTEDEAHRRLNE